MLRIDATSEAILLNRYIALVTFTKFNEKGTRKQNVPLYTKKSFAIQWQNIAYDLKRLFQNPISIAPHIAYSLLAFFYILQGKFLDAHLTSFFFMGAIAYDAAGQTSHSGEPATVSYTHTVGSGSDRLACFFGSGLATPNTPTFGGSTGSAIFTTVGNVIGRYVIAPSSGSNTVQMTGGNIKVLAGITFSGADQSSPIDATSTEDGTASPNDMSITSTVANTIRVDVLGANRDDSNSPSMTLDAGTNRCNPVTPQNQFRIGLSVYTNDLASTGSNTRTWTTSAFNRWYAAFNVKPSSGAAAPDTKQFFPFFGFGR